MIGWCGPALDRNALCPKCGHPRGWHWQGVGVCLECHCGTRFGPGYRVQVDEMNDVPGGGGWPPIGVPIIVDPACQKMVAWYDGTTKCMNPRWAHQGLGHEFVDPEIVRFGR